MRTALGIRVKSGWASAVLIGAESSSPVFLHRGRLLLADPGIPKSSQPYHRGFGRLQKDDTVLEKLTGIVYQAAARSLSGFVDECLGKGHQPTTIALVVGSTIDPERIGNEHIRAHASEARLFRVALERAASNVNLPHVTTRERDLRAAIATRSGAGLAGRVAALGRVAGRPWGSDEKLAALAAWEAIGEWRV
ncbi:MAG TPA: hypothetical protein VF219_00560 [Vicinamibacterales bacterium]